MNTQNSDHNTPQQDVGSRAPSRWIADGIEGWVGGIGDEEVATFATKVEAMLWRAAPDMLATLRRVEADLTHLGAKGEPLKSIRQAIAKAEGRS